MFEITGKNNTAKIFSIRPDEKAFEQIRLLCDQEFVKDAQIRIMPDYHFGAGCTIGFTANLGTKVIPNLVGVDIGCGMLCIELGKINLDLEKFDNLIKANVPSGRNSHNGRVIGFDDINDLICYRDLRHQGDFDKQIGTLGGGNHFIELDTDAYNNIYLVIHSGSRNMGKQVADYWQHIAIENCKGLGNLNEEKKKLIYNLKDEGKQSAIQPAIKQLEKAFRESNPAYPPDLCYLEGISRDEYLHDMKICQEYARLNRETMANIILQKLGYDVFTSFDYFHTTHNYVDFNDNTIRKGAVSAYKGEKIIIPINMRDGSLICLGKGNPDWNNSAPHGAGRLMGRNEAMRQLNLSEFTTSMDGVYTTTANASTLDEAPMAYKPMEEIVDAIQDTVEVVKTVTPIYNFKASE